MNPIGTESYKGVRDFYPEDMFVQKYLFETMRRVVRRFGYAEYNASILEPTELYKAKSGEEIINEQTYSFTDRGGRDVTLRPEMTPTVARMVAAKKRDLAFPLRWYSIPNLFRYEKPQRGRMREHWQLNVDLFGSTSLNAEVEMITIAYRIMEAFKATLADLEIKINHRAFLEFIMKDLYGLSEENGAKLTKLIDRKSKMPAADFKTEAGHVLTDATDSFIDLMNIQDLDVLRTMIERRHKGEIPGLTDLQSLKESLAKIGIATVFDPTLARGFDYYTGIVFEVFDTHEKNRKALFGGGRYDDLLSVFGSEKVPAVGFGMGDVRLLDFLEVRGLLPKYISSAQVSLCSVSEKNIPDSMALAEKLRAQGIAAAVDISGKKLGDQIKTAVKQSIPFALIMGDDEVKENNYTLRDLAASTEEKLDFEAIIERLSA